MIPSRKKIWLRLQTMELTYSREKASASAKPASALLGSNATQEEKLEENDDEQEQGEYGPWDHELPEVVP